jgi:hypothetical protein
LTFDSNPGNMEPKEVSNQSLEWKKESMEQ